MPLPLSVAIVCKNNASSIGATLDSVAGLADEIVAIDSGSTDGTIELIEARGGRVIRSEWLGHIRTKQLAMEAAQRDWVLSIDSDEVVLPALRDSIAAALSGAATAVRGFEINRKVYYRGKPLDFAWQPEWRLRLVRRGAARWGGIDPHDVLSLIDGSAPARLAGDLRHDSFATFAEHLGKQVGYSRLSAEGLLARGVRGSPWRLLTSPPGAFLKQLVLKQAWRDGVPGWLAAGTQAAGSLMKHMMLLEGSRPRR